jgi:hypothetical protein
MSREKPSRLRRRGGNVIAAPAVLRDFPLCWRRAPLNHADIPLGAIAPVGRARTVRRMIEASVILLVGVAALGLFFGSRLMAQNARKDPVAELARLHETLAWHEERLRQAKERNWDRDMVHQINEQLEDTRFQVAQVKSRAASAH